MSEKFNKSEWVPPEYRDLNRFKGMTLKEVIENLEASEGKGEVLREEPRPEAQPEKEPASVFDGFLELLRAEGIRVSVPEWLQFLTVLEKKATADELKEMVSDNELLNKIRLFAKATLIKDKADEAAFHEAFDEYFEMAAKIYSRDFREEIEDVLEQPEDVDPEEERDSEEEPEQKEKLDIDKVDENLNPQQSEDVEPEEEPESDDERDSEEEPEQKEKLDIDKVDENLNPPEDSEHDDKESVHGGKKDQHNDILNRKDLSKEGGGDKEKRQLAEEGFLVGGGKGKSITAQREPNSDVVHEGKKLDKEDIERRKERVRSADRSERYEVRPDRASMRQVIRNIRKIVLDISEVKSRNVDLKRTVKNFARRNFRFDYEREREKQPEIVLFIDVGGPVDEWSPLMKEITEEMAKGLSKLEVYLFHNNLYGYVWKPNPKDMLASSYAEPNSLIDLKKVVKKRKKVIIYGDAEMSYSEFEEDRWPPQGNDDRVERFGMGGDDCLKFIKKKSDSVVWINPVFRREWEDRDDSGTIQATGDIIPMDDLTVGGVEDAIKLLMKK